MPLKIMSAADLLGGFMDLLPKGKAWPRDPNSVQAQAFGTLMPTYARLAARDNYLVTDAFPATAVELLPEWEVSLGLPDPCAGAAPTVEQRQAQVVARLTASGGQSVSFFIDYAAALGATVTVSEFEVARCDITRCEEPCNDDSWAFAWQINLPSGSPLQPVVICESNTLKPAHTVLLFGNLPAATWDTSLFDESVFAP